MPSTVLGQKWAEEKRRAGPNGRGRALGSPLNVLGQQHSHYAGPTHPLYSPNLRLSRENFNFPWIFMFQPPEKLPLWALLPSCQPSMTEASPGPPREGGDWSSLAGLGKAQRQRQQQGRQPPGPDHSDAEEPYVAELA